MTFTEAVGLAKAGNEAGFTYLYEQTYKKSFYVAKKYMKNDDTGAEDVLQIAYVKAFNNLGQLEDPEKFQGWFSRIVANTSFRELQKKTPTLFSQMNDEDTDIKFEDTIENSNVDFQPEASIDGKETQRLVKEMLDTLSDEQRMCVMMYYYEDIPVKDEALILGVSENTVKSRLNYGRKAIKEKVLDLEKRGTKLYGILPIGFFIYLLKQDAAAATPLAGLAGISGIIGSASSSAAGNIKAGASHVAKKAAASATKAALRVKVTIGAAAAAVAVTAGVTVAVKRAKPAYTDVPCVVIAFHEKLGENKYNCYYMDTWTDPGTSILKEKVFTISDNASINLYDSSEADVDKNDLFEMTGKDFKKLKFESVIPYNQYEIHDLDKNLCGSINSSSISSDNITYFYESNIFGETNSGLVVRDWRLFIDVPPYNDDGVPFIDERPEKDKLTDEDAVVKIPQSYEDVTATTAESSETSAEETMSTEETTTSTVSSDVSESDKKEAAEEEARVVVEFLGNVSSYNAENPEFFWDCIYGYIIMYPEQCNAIEKATTEDTPSSIIVDKAMAEQVAAGMFAGCTKLLPIPAEHMDPISVDPSDPDKYVLYVGDASPYDIELKSWKDNGDGTYEAQYELTEWPEGNLVCIETVTYCDNTYSVGGAKPLLPISVISAEFQDI